MCGLTPILRDPYPPLTPILRGLTPILRVVHFDLTGDSIMSQHDGFSLYRFLLLQFGKQLMVSFRDQPNI